MGKPRADSWLKTLAEERQAQVIEWCNKPADRDEAGKPIPKSGGYEHARQQIAADGISVSVRALSDFYSWYHLHETFARADQKTADFLELMQGKFPDLKPAQIQEFGQAFFTMEATASGNAEEFRAMEKLRLDKETAETKARQEEKKLELAERRVRLLEKKIEEAEKALDNSKLSDAEKAQRIRQIFKRE